MKRFFVVTCLAISVALSHSAQSQPMTNGASPTLRCADFQRNADGSWVTQRQTLVPYPNGIVPFNANTVIPAGDNTYMGLRLGRVLDERCSAPGRR